MTEASRHSWFNGTVGDLEQGAPSVASISFHLGTGVFDGMMAYWNNDHYYILEAEAHFERFIAGCAKMGMPVSWTIDDLLVGVYQLLELEPRGTQYIRPIAYRRGPELWVTGAEGRPVDVSIFTVKTAGFRDLDAPLRCQLSPIERISSRSIPGQVKVSGSYVNSVYARKTAEAAGFSDGIMFDRCGHVAEASAANIFFLCKDKLITPPLNPDVFPGITRRVVLNIAKRNGIAAEERNITRDQLKEMDGAFLCSTLMEIRAISALDVSEIDTVGNALFRRVINSFRTITHK